MSNRAKSCATRIKNIRHSRTRFGSADQIAINVDRKRRENRGIHAGQKGSRHVAEQTEDAIDSFAELGAGDRHLGVGVAQDRLQTAASRLGTGQADQPRATRSELDESVPGGSTRL